MPDLQLNSVPALLLHRAKVSSDRAAFEFPRGDDGWQTMTWQQSLARVQRISAGLQAVGVEPLACGAILSNTRIEWLLADLGILCAGATTTTIYPSNTPEECAYIISIPRPSKWYRRQWTP